MSHLDNVPGSRYRPMLRNSGTSRHAESAVAQIGFVGLGRMGGNMVARIKRDSDHDVVAFDRDQDTVERIARGDRRARRATRSQDLVAKLDAPRMVWIMVPAGAPTQGTVDELAELLEPGDTIVDGGNSKWTDDKARAAALEQAGHRTTSTSARAAACGAWRSATA